MGVSTPIILDGGIKRLSDDWLNYWMVALLSEMFLQVLMMMILYVAFNHICLAKGFYLLEVVSF